MSGNLPFYDERFQYLEIGLQNEKSMYYSAEEHLHMSLSLNDSITSTKDVFGESCLSTKLLCALEKFTSIISIIHETNESYWLRHQTQLKFLLIIESIKKNDPIIFCFGFCTIFKNEGFASFRSPCILKEQEIF